MPYTTRDEVREILARVEQGPSDIPEDTAASLPDGVIDDSIEQAESEINARLGVRYQVPFTDPAPKSVRDLATDIAAYLSDLTYRETRDYESELNPVYLRYKRAMQLLADIAKGAATLPENPPGSGGDSGGISVAGTYGGELVFNECDFQTGSGLLGSQNWPGMDPRAYYG